MIYREVRQILIQYGGAQVTLSLENEVAHLYALRTTTTERKKGHAKKVIRICKKYAMKKKIKLHLFASAYWDKPMSNELLVQFYQKMGFKIIPASEFSKITHLEFTPK